MPTAANTHGCLLKLHLSLLGQLPRNSFPPEPIHDRVESSFLITHQQKTCQIYLIKFFRKFANH